MEKAAFKGLIYESVSAEVRRGLDYLGAEILFLASEIRLRVDRPLALRAEGRDYFAKSPLSRADVDETLSVLSGFSLYAYAEELKRGFITIRGGHRVGIAGEIVAENGVIKTVKNVNALNFRIAREIKGSAAKLFEAARGNKNVIIISPPGRGKTTVLRDLTRLVSDGGLNAALIDERGEIAACRLGEPQNDVGRRTDVLDLCPKREGVELALRSLSPQVVVLDELFGSDVAAAEKALFSGVNLFCTAHGNNARDALKNSGLDKLAARFEFVICSLKPAGELGIEKIEVYGG